MPGPTSSQAVTGISGDAVRSLMLLPPRVHVRLNNCMIQLSEYAFSEFLYSN